ncbi:MAG: M28 family metallopeptidase [bacterium]|jgi:Zn-dependent M28 family amino/carboxypeptidase
MKLIQINKLYNINNLKGTKIDIDKSQVKNNLEILSSDEFDGRLVGTEGNFKAQEFLVNKFKEYNLKPFNNYLQNFKWNGLNVNNVIGIVEGQDPELKKEAIIVGAHFDHIGEGFYCFKVPGDKICNGADDNTSGTVSMLELARLFSKYPTKRTIIFVGFNAEEMGLIGSKNLANELKELLPNYNIKYMINMDMVGRNGNKPLTAIYDSLNPKEANFLKETLENLNSNKDFDIIKGENFHLFPYSDHYSFYKKGVPVIMFTSLLHNDYHKATDEANKIDYTALFNRIQAIYNIVNILANS